MTTYKYAQGAYMKPLSLSLIILCSAALMGCQNAEGPASDPQIRDYLDTFTPLPSAPVYPQGNQYNQIKEQLGELLFWDPILSGNQNVSCASCHHPDFGWADGRALSVGSDGVGLGPDRFGSQITPLHSPSILNVAFTGLENQALDESFVSGGYFWDLRAQTLEQQALGPITNPVEMLGFAIDAKQAMPELINRLQSIPEYVALFEQAFEQNDAITNDTTSAITSENIAKALATFQRKIISPNTRFDQFLAGNQSVFTEREIIGLNKFIDGGCARCHGGPMLSDNLIHIGEAIINNHVVRTPTLRNISHTAPYMHDGSRSNLQAVLADYEDRGDIEVNIEDEDFADIIAFLATLNTDVFYKDKPVSVPSGLPVGGDI